MDGAGCRASTATRPSSMDGSASSRATRTSGPTLSSTTAIPTSRVSPGAFGATDSCRRSSMDNEEVAVEKKRPGMPDYMSVPEPVIRASHFEEDRLKLHPDLQPWLQMDGYFGPQLKHP